MLLVEVLFWALWIAGGSAVSAFLIWLLLAFRRFDRENSRDYKAGR